MSNKDNKSYYDYLNDFTDLVDTTLSNILSIYDNNEKYQCIKYFHQETHRSKKESYLKYYFPLLQITPQKVTNHLTGFAIELQSYSDSKTKNHLIIGLHNINPSIDLTNEKIEDIISYYTHLKEAQEIVSEIVKEEQKKGIKEFTINANLNHLHWFKNYNLTMDLGSANENITIGSTYPIQVANRMLEKLYKLPIFN